MLEPCTACQSILGKQADIFCVLMAYILIKKVSNSLVRGVIFTVQCCKTPICIIMKQKIESRVTMAIHTVYMSC